MDDIIEQWQNQRLIRENTTLRIENATQKQRIEELEKALHDLEYDAEDVIDASSTIRQRRKEEHHQLTKDNKRLLKENEDLKRLLDQGRQLDSYLDWLLNWLENMRHNSVEMRDEINEAVQKAQAELREALKTSGKELSFASSVLLTAITTYQQSHFNAFKTITYDVAAKLTVDGSRYSDRFANVQGLVFEIIREAKIAEYLSFAGLIATIIRLYEGDGRMVAQDVIDQLKTGAKPQITHLEVLLPYIKATLNTGTVTNCPATAQQLQINLVRHHQFKSGNYTKETNLSDKQHQKDNLCYEAIEAIAKLDDEMPFMGLPLAFQAATVTKKKNSSFLVPIENAE